MGFIDGYRAEWKFSALIIKDYFIEIPLSSLEVKCAGKNSLYLKTSLTINDGNFKKLCVPIIH